MRHEEVEARLPGYASGTLADEDERAVRAHLASGCRDCLSEVFQRPLGLPRPSRPQLHGGVRAPIGRARWALGVLLLGVAVGAGALGWHDANRGERAAPSTQTVQTVQTMQVTTGTDVERLRGRLLSLKATARALHAATQDLAEERQGLRSDVALLSRRAREAERRVAGLRAQLDRDSRRLVRLEETLEANRPLVEAAAAAGVGFARFRSARGYRHASGHVLWDRESGRAFVYAFDLPFADQPQGWVVRLASDRAGRRRLGALQPTAARAAGAHLGLPHELGCDGRLEVVTADRGEIAMTAGLGACDGGAEPRA